MVIFLFRRYKTPFKQNEEKKKQCLRFLYYSTKRKIDLQEQRQHLYLSYLPPLFPPYNMEKKYMKAISIIYMDYCIITTDNGLFISPNSKYEGIGLRPPFPLIYLSHQSLGLQLPRILCWRLYQIQKSEANVLAVLLDTPHHLKKKNQTSKHVFNWKGGCKTLN